METTFIYALNDPRPSHRKAYVGKANDPFGRLHGANGHLKDKAATHKTCWIKKLKALGREPVLEILDEVPIAEWEFWEREWIRLYRVLMFDLVNGTDGGDAPPIPRGHSAETRAKLSVAATGRKHTPEARAKMSASHTGVKLSPERCLNIGRSNRGRVHSEETRTKQRTASRPNNTSGVTGVCYCKRRKKWEAQIMKAGKQFHLGYFSTLEEAATVRAAALPKTELSCP